MRYPDRDCGVRITARRYFSPDFVPAQIKLYQPGQRVPENADHSVADRTLDRAGAAQESVERQDQAPRHKVQTKVSAERRSRDRVLPLLLPRAREIQL